MMKSQTIQQTTKTNHAQGQSLAQGQGHLPVLQGQAHLAHQGRGQGREDAAIPAHGPGNMGQR